MEIALYIVAKAVQILLEVISFAMLLRVILQFFVDVEENKFYALCFWVSEIFVSPFRLIMSKLGIGEDSPLDIPFFIAYISLSAISMFLPII